MVKFLEYGEVDCICYDDSTRQVALKISSPWNVIQPVMAIMLGYGFVDSLKVRHPIVAWTPVLPQDRFKESAISEVPNISERVNQVVQERTIEILNFFKDLTTVLKNPDDVIGILPMGIYVTFQFRTDHEKFAEMISKIEFINSPGVAEIRFAFASVLAGILIQSDSVKSLEV
jgi:hypothetical protein